LVGNVNNSEISKHKLIVLPDKHIGGFDVPVNHQLAGEAQLRGAS
jgi:hypothetical protein